MTPFTHAFGAVARSLASEGAGKHALRTAATGPRPLRPGRRDSRGQILFLAAGVALVCLVVIGLVVDYGRAAALKRSYQGSGDDIALTVAYYVTTDQATTSSPGPYTTSQMETRAMANIDQWLTGNSTSYTLSGGVGTIIVNGQSIAITFEDSTGAPTTSGTIADIGTAISGTSSNFFMSLMGNTTTSVTAGAVAKVGAPPVPYFPCMLCLGATSGTTLSGANGSSITSTGGSIALNSDSTNAINDTSNITVGSGDAITYVSPGSASCSGCSVTPTAGNAFPDPYAGTPAPSVSTAGTISCDSHANTCTLTPGVFSGGVTIPNGDTATLSPGIYVMTGGGFIMSNNAVLQSTAAPADTTSPTSAAATGTGVLLYFTCSGYTTASTETCPSSPRDAPETSNCPSSASGDAVNGFDASKPGITVNFLAPTQGTYQNMGIFYDPNDPAMLCLSNNGAVVSQMGTIYAADSYMNILNNANLTYGNIDVAGLQMTQNTTLVINSSLPAATPLTTQPQNPGLVQ